MVVRVLQIVTYMGRGGLETMLMNYYRHINRDKVQFDFLVHRDFEADYDQEINRLGGKIYHISRLNPCSPFYREKLKKFLKTHQEYKIVHVHQDCLSSVALQCAKECGIPVRIAHSHNSNQNKNIKFLIKKYYMKKIPLYATHLFACGEKAGDWMFSGEKYEIIHNAIDVKKYTYSREKARVIREKMHLENNVVIGHVGRFDLQKNHVFLLYIFTECIKAIPNAKLLLVGDGEERKDIEARARELGINNNVIFTGVRSDVEDLFQVMDIFVFPSLYEGLPVTMIEAQAAGLPCVISDKVPNECIVTSGLVTPMKLSESPHNWAEQIVKSIKIQRKNHLEEIQNSGYDIATEVGKLEKFYLRNYGE